MKNKSPWLLCCVAIALIALPAASRMRAESESVKLLRVPNGGLQPQAVLDSRGVLHLIYFSGEPQSGNIFYVQRAAVPASFAGSPMDR